MNNVPVSWVRVKDLYVGDVVWLKNPDNRFLPIIEVYKKCKCCGNVSFVCASEFDDDQVIRIKEFSYRANDRICVVGQQ